MTSGHPFEGIGPEVLLSAVESVGLVPDGRFIELNSYENRVYQVGLEEASPVVVKLYRPGRWSDEAILEEHAFSHRLAEHEIPVVAPLPFGGNTLFHHAGFRFAVFERRGGRAPELDDPHTRTWLGRFLGRIHTVGETQRFRHRPRLSAAAAREDRDWLLANDWIPAYLLDAYETLTRDLLDRLDRAFEGAAGLEWIALHGDCHPGNVLWTEAGPHFVDLDDCLTGPAVQDLWMLLSGERPEMTVQLGDIIDGYEDFREFDRRELALVEPLRTSRVLRYAAWIARRWDDPAFPRAFPWFAEGRFWESHLLALREQAAALDEPPLVA